MDIKGKYLKLFNKSKLRNGTKTFTEPNFFSVMDQMLERGKTVGSVEFLRIPRLCTRSKGVARQLVYVEFLRTLTHQKKSGSQTMILGEIYCTNT